MGIPLKVIVVEDSMDDHELLVRELERGGYAPQTVRVDTPEALREVLAEPGWEIVISDYIMPRFSGLAALELLRQSGRDLPFIVISGTVGEDVAVETMRAGAHDYLMKENLTRLVPAVRRELREVTERREHRQADEALKESERRFRTLSEASPQGVFLHDNAGKCLYINSCGSEITGYSSAEMVGTDWFHILHPDDVERAAAEWEAFRQNEHKIFESDLRLLHANGTTRWVQVRVGKVRDEQGVATDYVGSLVDITQHLMFQERLLQAQKQESLGRLAGGIAHDFNNILTAILGYAELASDLVPPEHAAQERIRNIQKAAGRAADLIRQLLAFASKQMITPRVITLNSVLEETGSLLLRLIGSHIKLEILPGSDVGAIRADPGQMQQILINLGVNARDAMPEGGKLTIATRSVHLEAGLTQDNREVLPGNYVLLEVTDTGIGMNKEILQHIFEPFFTTKEIGKGTGLGLATCHGIVRQNGGHIWVESEVGKGTSFRITLPQVNEIPTKEKEPETLSYLGGKETILLVEDDALLRELTAEALRAEGYAVIEAASGKEALVIATAFTEPIHLLVTDVVMPLMSGKELAQKMLKVQPDLRILFISGYAENAVMTQGILESGVLFLPKPFSVAGLAHKVRAVLDQLMTPASEGNETRQKPLGTNL